MKNFKWIRVLCGTIIGIVSAIFVFIMICNIGWKLLLFAILLGGIIFLFVLFKIVSEIGHANYKFDRMLKEYYDKQKKDGKKNVENNNK